MERNQYKIITSTLVILLIGACFFSIIEEEQAPIISYENIPAPKHNLMDQDKVALGKELFFDPKLSKDSTVACVSCHLPNYAFGENVALSTSGVTHRSLKRNSPTLINIAWANGWFWDGGAKNIESLIFGPLTHEDEMGIDLKILMKIINQDQYYKERFTTTFKVDKVYSSHLARALAQYVRTLISNQSNYDLFLKGKYQFSENEQKGYIFFQNNCASCHSEPFFTDFQYHNNGLDSIFNDDFEGISKGRGRITRVAKDNGKYKTPTLRNIFASAPYMHDGRFNTIDEVLNHYQHGIIHSPTLDTTLIDKQIRLTHYDKTYLKAFLNTLMDSIFLDIKKEVSN